MLTLEDQTRRTHRYLTAIGSALDTVISAEQKALERKHALFFEGNYRTIDEIVRQQRNQLSGAGKHIVYFIRHRESILGDAAGEDYKDAHKDDSVLDFIFEHWHTYFLVLRHQEMVSSKLARAEHTSSRHNGHHKNHDRNQLWDYFQREEVLFAEYLDLCHTCAESIDQEIDYLRGHERYEHIERLVLRMAITCSALPLGPAELLVLPLWGTWFGMHQIEKHRESFGHWRNVVKLTYFPASATPKQ